MPAPARELRTSDPPPRPAAGPPERRPFRDNPRLILLGILILLAALVAMVTLADRAPEMNPNFLTEVVLYALSAADLTMLVALGFVLARNVIKLAVERRRGLPFSRFRAKLVGALLGLTIIPAMLVLLVGSELIRSSTEKWVSQPVDDVLSSAKQIAGEYYREREAIVAGEAANVARTVPAAAVRSGDSAALRRQIESVVTQGRIRRLEVYALVPGGEPVPLVAAQSPSLPRTDVRATSDRFAARVASGSASIVHERLDDGGELVQAGALVRDPATRQPLGVVVASDHLTGELATESRRIISAYENYSRLRVLSRPLQGMYLGLFLMMTLMILVSATWMGLYLAKRITRPVQMLAAGAREIGAGHLDFRIEPETRDEFGSLIEAFNSMAGELAAGQRKLERSRVDLERKNVQLDERRRYIETVLERIATGVVSIGADGGVETINGAAVRLLGVDRGVVGTPADDIFAREDLRPLGVLVRQGRAGVDQPAGAGGHAGAGRARAAPRRRRHAVPAGRRQLRRRGAGVRRCHAAHPDAARGGVARRGPPAGARDQESADADPALRRADAAAVRRRAAAGARPGRGVHDDDRRRGRVAQGAGGRVRAVRADAGAEGGAGRSAARCSTEALALYTGLFRRIRIETRFDASLPPVRLDVEQIRRVVINLVDNAVEALGGPAAGERPGGAAPLVLVETRHDPGHGVARIVIADNGPGISAADRDKLFMPYYSTKQRGSGLGLAIVRRIIVEHGGSIEVEDNEPAGTRFVIELPL